MNKILYFIIAVTFVGCGVEKNITKKERILNTEKQTFINRNKHKTQTWNHIFPQDEVKNVILMIGDGMGQSVLSSAWVSNGNSLNITNIPTFGTVITTAKDSIITDSAAAATAMATGKKTNRRHLSVDVNGNPLKTLTEYAQEMNKSVGLVATCHLQDATPAAFAAKNKSRKAAEAITENYVNSGINVVFGGGRDYFEKRTDGKNLINELKNNGYQVITEQKFDQITQSKVYGLFAPMDLPPATERNNYLTNATMKAIDLLSGNKNGFFLMVESSLIDEYGHSNDYQKVIDEVLDFDQTVASVLEWAKNNPNTLVIITADHATGGVVLHSGEPTKGLVIGSFSSTNHDGVFVPIFAYGVQAETFRGMYENTEIFDKILKIMK